jgi:hypothetical protein
VTSAPALDEIPRIRHGLATSPPYDRRMNETSFSRSGRCARIVLALAAFAVAAAGPARAAPAPCARAKDSYFVDWMVVRADRAYFYSEAADRGSAPSKLGRYVVRGDFLLVRLPDPRQNPPTGMDVDFQCVDFVRPNGSGSYGWLPKSDLLSLESFSKGEGPEPPAELKSLFERMPAVTSWPETGQTNEPVERANFLCVRRFDAEKKRLCLDTSTRNPGEPECGSLGPGNRYATFDAEGWYVAYLFNNGVLIVSETGMWGNHGQSDPTGFYVPTAASVPNCSGPTAPGPRRPR